MTQPVSSVYVFQDFQLNTAETCETGHVTPDHDQKFVTFLESQKSLFLEKSKYLLNK